MACSAVGICWLALGDDRDVLVKGLRRPFPQAHELSLADPSTSICGREAAPGGWAASLDRTSKWLRQALAAIEQPGKGAGLPLDLRGTSFQLAVWGQLQQIRAGEVISYADLARRVGRPKAFRAVAQACGANPVGVLVPCHRVIAADGGLGGFGFGLARKRELLRREGVGF